MQGSFPYRPLPPRRPPPRPSIRDGINFAHMLNGLGTLVALILSIIGVVITLSHINNSTDSIITNGSLSRLSLYDDTVQPLLGSNIWTPVTFRKHSHLAPDTWQHLSGSSSLVCLKSGTYVVSYRLHTNLVSNPNASFQCQACQAWLETRCTLQSVVLTRSVSFLSRAVGFHAVHDQFLVDLLAGDVLQIEVRSHCALIVLTNMTQKRLPQFNDPITSASIVIH